MVRSLVSLGSNGGSFSGRLTGGGDRSNAGQTFTYQFRMPRGQPELNLGVQLADPNYQLPGFLTDPNGEPLDVQSTAAFDATDKPLGFGPTMQFFRPNPSGGLWTLTLLVNGPGRRHASERALPGPDLVRCAAGHGHRHPELPAARSLGARAGR